MQVPPDTVVLLATLEGALEVRHPDFVAVGSQGEVYANAADWVREHLTFHPAGAALRSVDDHRRRGLYVRR